VTLIGLLAVLLRVAVARSTYRPGTSARPCNRPLNRPLDTSHSWRLRHRRTQRAATATAAPIEKSRSRSSGARCARHQPVLPTSSQGRDRTHPGNTRSRVTRRTPQGQDSHGSTESIQNLRIARPLHSVLANMSRSVASTRQVGRQRRRERHVDQQLQPASGSSRLRTASAA
jgi:hypothetical protein